MPATETADAQRPKHPQERAQVRRQKLLGAARRLLHDNRLDQLSLPAISREAGIPPSSTYHFFKDVQDLYRDLAVQIAQELLGLTPADSDLEGWDDLVRVYLHGAADFFNGDRAGLQLILGEQTTLEIKRATCGSDAPFGMELYKLIDHHFVMPQIDDPEGVFFRTIRIADTFFSLSVSEHGHITDTMRAESCRAACAYLSVYLPPRLARRSEAADEHEKAPGFSPA